MKASTLTALLLTTVAVVCVHTAAVPHSQSDLTEDHRQLLDHHWGYFIYGVFFFRSRIRAIPCPRLRLRAARKGMEIDCTPESQQRRVEIAMAVIDSGVEYEETEDGIAFEALPSIISVEDIDSDGHLVTAYARADVTGTSDSPISVSASASASAGLDPDDF